MIYGEVDEYVLGCSITIYVIFILIAQGDIRDDIRYYARRALIKNVSIENYLKRNKSYLIFWGSLLFPIYYCLKYSMFYAKLVYNILTEDNDENRIASWFF